MGTDLLRQLLHRSALLAGILLLAVGVLRSHDLAIEGAGLRNGIGERSWTHYATRPDARGHLDALLGRTLEGEIDGSAWSPEQAQWLLSMVRYACPSSTVRLRGDGGVGTALTVEGACVPEAPDFVRPGPRSPPARWFVSSVLLLGLGSLLVHRTPGAASAAEAVAAGWALAALAAWCLRWWGLPLEGAWIGVTLVAAASWWLSRRAAGDRSTESGRADGPCARPAGRSMATALLSVPLLLLLASLAKVLGTALWSWDHHSIWGFKARALAAGGDSFLTLPGFEGAAPDYPLGVPLGWWVTSLGGVPGPADVRWSAALLLVLASAMLWCELGPSPLRPLLVALFAGGPLFWDTEALGLAEQFLAVWALLALRGASRGGLRGGAVATLGLLSLVSSKNEGLVLALALLPLVLHRLRPDRAAVLGCLTGSLVGTASIRIATAWQTDADTSFLMGDWRSRLVDRLGSPAGLVTDLARVLADPVWLGVWWLVAAALTLWVLRWASRRGRLGAGDADTVLLAAAVVVPMVVYALVYFATRFEPALHIATSWHRIVAPVSVLGLLLVARVAEPKEWSSGAEGALSERRTA